MNYPEILLKKGTIQPTAIRQLKEQLNLLGYGPLDEQNGTFGDSTKAAVVKFQIDKLLNPDGEVGPLTWHRLYTDRLPIIEVATTLSEVALEIALSQLYVREKTGKNDGKEVEDYLESVGLGKGFAWCMAFVFWCYEQAAIKLNVENPLYATAGVLNFYHKTPKEHRVTEPRKGDLGLMNFGGGKGHIFFVKKTIERRVATVEGNTSGDPTTANEDRDGQGVFERLRNKSAAFSYLRF